MEEPLLRSLTAKLVFTLVTALAPLLALLVPVTVLSTSTAYAQEDEAQKLYDDAMDNDYLNTKFDDAIAKLNKAVKQCGKKCGKGMRGKLHIALAVVHGAGKQDNKAARAELEKAFKADKNAKPLDLYFTDDLKKLYAEAKKAAATAGDDDDDDGGKKPPKGDDDDDGGKKPPKGDDDDDGAAGGSVDWKPPKEAQVNTPLPIYLPVDEGLGADSAKLRYKPFGETKWLSVAMKKMEGGFGAVIPCAQLTTTGKLKLYIFLKDKSGDPVAQAGSSKAPLEVTVKNEIEDDQPSFPGEKPPKKCSTVECPPDFPGCGEGKPPSGERGNKGWGASCDKTEECKEGFVCLNGSCEEGKDDGGSGSGGGKPDTGDHALKKNIVFLGGQLDLLFLTSVDNVCGAAASSGNDKKFGTPDDSVDAPINYACFKDTSVAGETPEGEFLGEPSQNADGSPRFNQVEGGGVLAGGRILAGYDRIVYKGLTVGARIGYAFGGTPRIGDVVERFDACKARGGGFCRESGASNFLPFHGEVRLSYFFLENFIKQTKFLPRPYAYTGVGVGQVNGGVNVGVCDYVDNNGQPMQSAGDSRCPSGAQQSPGSSGFSRKREDIKAYQLTGLAFVPLGVGAIFPFHPNVGLSLEVKAMFMLPTFGVVLAPQFGPVGMF
jgi:hypothetical protein